MDVVKDETHIDWSPGAQWRRRLNRLVALAERHDEEAPTLIGRIPQRPLDHRLRSEQELVASTRQPRSVRVGEQPCCCNVVEHANICRSQDDGRPSPEGSEMQWQRSGVVELGGVQAGRGTSVVAASQVRSISPKNEVAKVTACRLLSPIVSSTRARHAPRPPQ